ncbi:uncharacterized protein ACIGJ3_008488 [Trichechus inunguis]
MFTFSTNQNKAFKRNLQRHLGACSSYHRTLQGKHFSSHSTSTLDQRPPRNTANHYSTGLGVQAPYIFEWNWNPQATKMILWWKMLFPTAIMEENQTKPNLAFQSNNFLVKRPPVFEEGIKE